PDSARDQVRLHRRRGATLIMIMPSDGVASIGDDPNALTMTDEEMTAIISTAHELGLKVAAHAHGKKAIDRAVIDGVDSFERCTIDRRSAGYRLSSTGLLRRHHRRIWRPAVRHHRTATRSVRDEGRHGVQGRR